MRKWTLTAALAFGAIVAFACAGKESAPITAEVRDVCDDFCDRAMECDADLVEGTLRDDCIQECYGKADECNDVGELEGGIEDLRNCAEDCDNFSLCSIDIDIDCFI